MHTPIVLQETKHDPCDGRDDGTREQRLEHSQHDLTHHLVPRRRVRLLEKEVAEVDDEDEEDVCDDDEGQEERQEEAGAEKHR
jgi:hypothetical protein